MNPKGENLGTWFGGHEGISNRTL